MFYPLLCGEIADIIDIMKKPVRAAEDVQIRVLDMADIVGLVT